MSPLLPRDLDSYLAQPSVPELEVAKLFGAGAAPVIFDIGACEGEDSLRYRRRFPQARIFTFEPLPDNQQLIRANFARYGMAEGQLVPLALSNRQGEAEFHVSSGRPAVEFAGRDWNYGNKSSSLLAPASTEPMYGWLEFKEAIRVRTTTLDQFCREHHLDRIDFIHLDVQGAEHLVLSGATTMLPRVGALWLEVSDRALYRGQKLRTEIETLLRARGFRLVFEQRGEIEGDQFYVNSRHVRSWSYLVARTLRTFSGRVRRRLFRRPSSP